MNLLSVFDRVIYYPVFNLVFIMGAVPARLRWDNLLKYFMRLNALLVLFVRRAEPKQDIRDAGQEWKRMFPGPVMQKIVGSDEHTVYFETHTWCPLRGSGDVTACYNMMEFDRSLLRKIGGQFVVLQSQAEPGVTVCRIAIRSQGQPVDDLVPAHKRHV